jgi:hypothetical protein
MTFIWQDTADILNDRTLKPPRYNLGEAAQ